MTLILTLANRDNVIHLCDRRLTADGKVTDEESEKSGSIITENARVLFGFTGLARALGVEMQHWMSCRRSREAVPMKTLCGVLLWAGVAAGARAADKQSLLNYIILGCAGPSPSALLIECEGTPPYSKMTCTLTRLWVDKPDATTTNKSKGDVFAAPDTEANATVDSACKELAKAASEEGGFVPEVRALKERSRQQLEEICKCKGKGRECVNKALVALVDAEAKSCTLHSMRYAATFVKSGAYRWMSQSGPDGLCKVVATETLDREEGYSNLLTYRLTEIVGNPDGQFCASAKSPRSEVCSWRYPRAALMNCEEIHFGP